MSEEDDFNEDEKECEEDDDLETESVQKLNGSESNRRNNLSKSTTISPANTSNV
jgi:hypothetical protein